MEQFARIVTLVALGRIWRVEPRKTFQADAAQNLLTVAFETPTRVAIRWQVHLRQRRLMIFLRTCAGMRLGMFLGLLERSWSPATPSSRKRPTHLPAVFSLTLKAAAAAFSVRPPSITVRVMFSRPMGVSLALL